MSVYNNNKCAVKSEPSDEIEETAEDAIEAVDENIEGDVGSGIKEEFTAAVDPKALQEMYGIATSDEYGFLFLNLKGNRFFRSFKSELKAT